MKRILIVSGLVALLVPGFMAYTTGAPASTCDMPTMEPICHKISFNAIGYDNINQYILNITSQSPSPGLIEVTLSGPIFKGFVLRATTTGKKNFGKFIEADNTSSFNHLKCSNPEYVAVTHTDPHPKEYITLLWDNWNNTGNPTFQATTVQDIFEYVRNIFES